MRLTQSLPKALAQARGFLYIPIAQCVLEPCAELAARFGTFACTIGEGFGFFRDVVDQLVERSLLVRYHVVATGGNKARRMTRAVSIASRVWLAERAA